jgi:3-oxoadipate enol-lactonase
MSVPDAVNAAGRDLRPLALDGPVGRLGGWTLRDLRGAVPVLFLHPLNTEGRAWLPVATRLEGRPAVLPDLRGHGAASPAGPFSISHWVDDAVAVLDHLGLDEVHVAGGSLGGAIAVELAARAPERVRSIASFGGSLHVHEDSAQFRAMLDLHGVEGTWRLLIPEVSVAPGSPDAIVEAAIALANRNEAVVVAGILDAALSTDVRDHAALVRCPALVVCGEHDGTSPPEHSHAMAARLGVEAVVMPGIGHLTMLEDPSGTARLLAAHIERAG